MLKMPPMSSSQHLPHASDIGYPRAQINLYELSLGNSDIRYLAMTHNVLLGLLQCMPEIRVLLHTV